MVVRRLLAGATARATVPVFAVVGSGARVPVEDLALRRELRLVDSPRHATVLLVAGSLPHSLVRPLAHVHDQLPHPRATVWWTGASPGDLGAVVPGPVTVEAERDPVDAVVAAHRDLLTGSRRSEANLLPDRIRPPWRGVGPHGQGGEGMMAGKPYGRPMPMTGPDRDGLELDRLPLTVGPFFPHFPPGLALEVVLQGDVVQEAQPGPNPFVGDDPSPQASGGPVDRDRDVFHEALRRPVAVRDLELARARHHLRWVARALKLHGAAALSRRTLRLSHEVGPDGANRVAALRRLLERTGWPRWAMDGVGTIDGRLLDGGLGPVARAAGVDEDERADDAAYAGLGFEPVVHEAGDALARFRQRMREAEQALRLAQRAGDGISEPRGEVEGPRGRIDADGDATGRLVALLPDVLAGLEWGDAVTTVVGLDLDLEAAAGHRTRTPVG